MAIARCLDLEREAQERADEHDRGQHRHASETRRRWGQCHRPPAVPGRAGWPGSAAGETPVDITLAPGERDGAGHETDRRASQDDHNPAASMTIPILSITSL